MIQIEMEMPKRCGECRFASAFDCLINGKFITDHNERAEHCPLKERPHGEWVLDKEFSFVFNMYECSKCRFNGSKRWKFCPNCGSDNRPRILDEAIDGEGKDGNVKEGEAE